MIGADKFKDHPVRLVNSETPDFMVLGMQFLSVKRTVEGVAFKQVRFYAAFRWMVDDSFSKSGSNVAVVAISIIGNCHSIKSRKDCL